MCLFTNKLHGTLDSIIDISIPDYNFSCRTFGNHISHEFILFVT